MRVFHKRSRIPASASNLFEWHARPGTFERLTPPWIPARVVERTGGIEDGARLVMRIGVGPVGIHWTAEHRDYIPGQQFCDVQVSGPFAHWEHVHRFEPAGDDASFLDDRISYRLPLEALGGWLGGPISRRALDRMFTYRDRVTIEDLVRHRRYEGSPLRVLVTGASGMVGRELCAFLTTGGHEVLRAVRGRSAGEDEVSWDVERGLATDERLQGLDAVVHLAGENIAGARWSDEVKRRIRASREVGTRRLCESLAALAKPPRVLVSASAIGFYGDRGEEVVDERSQRGSGFLSDVCVAWEEATTPARDAGIRTVLLRNGVVLSAGDGALKKMLPPFLVGLGGRIGDGRQIMRWIALDDLLAVFLHVIRDRQLEGPVNAVGPVAVSNAAFTKTLGRVLHRPTIAPLPAFAARALFGEMADEMLLAGARVVPTRLLESGFEFLQPDLEDALRHTLGRGR